jgi:hypothetical protein
MMPFLGDKVCHPSQEMSDWVILGKEPREKMSRITWRTVYCCWSIFGIINKGVLKLFFALSQVNETISKSSRYWWEFPLNSPLSFEAWLNCLIDSILK